MGSPGRACRGNWVEVGSDRGSGVRKLQFERASWGETLEEEKDGVGCVRFSILQGEERERRGAEREKREKKEYEERDCVCLYVSVFFYVLFLEILRFSNCTI